MQLFLFLLLLYYSLVTPEVCSYMEYLPKALAVWSHHLSLVVVGRREEDASKASVFKTSVSKNVILVFLCNWVYMT